MRIHDIQTDSLTTVTRPFYEDLNTRRFNLSRRNQDKAHQQSGLELRVNLLENYKRRLIFAVDVLAARMVIDTSWKWNMTVELLEVSLNKKELKVRQGSQ